ncbi:MAG: hypothetical protein HY887_03785 [Deltaproteobacteria bacterium]|nr:hypothetical protein [Deltaproteobacteria bacterium]
MLESLLNIPTLLSSIGLILAISSFISGLQLVRGIKGGVEGIIHKFNGIVGIAIYIILAVLSFKTSGIGLWSFLGWLGGLFLFFLKLFIVKKGRHKRRAAKYISWLGGMLTLMWLYLVYIHLPL